MSWTSEFDGCSGIPYDCAELRVDGEPMESDEDLMAWIDTEVEYMAPPDLRAYIGSNIDTDLADCYQTACRVGDSEVEAMAKDRVKSDLFAWISDGLMMQGEDHARLWLSELDILVTLDFAEA